MNKKLDIDTEMLVQRIIEGNSMRELATEFNCSVACIYKRVRKNYDGSLKAELEEALQNNYKNSFSKRWKGKKWKN